MKKLIATLLTLILTLSLFQICALADKEKTKDTPSEESKYVPHGECMLVCDVGNGYKVYSKGSNKVINPYGFTKVLTAITVIENQKDLTKMITVPDNILKDYDYSYGNIGLASGEIISIKDLLYAMLMQDAGDCAIALAHTTGKSYDEFIKLLNDTAKKAGANNSVFTEPAGFSGSAQKTTLDDMYKISAYALKNEAFANITKTSQYKITKTNLREYDRNMFSKNKFMSRFYSEDYINPNISAIKEYYNGDNDTGLIVRYKKGEDDLMILVAKSDRAEGNDYVYDDVLSLIEKGNGFFTELKLIEKEEFVSEINLKTAKNTDRALIIALDNIYIKVPKDYNKELITREITLRENIDAPIEKFEELGEIKVYYDKTYVGGAKVASYHKVERSLIKDIGYTLLAWLGSVYFWIIIVAGLLIIRITKKKRVKNKNSK